MMPSDENCPVERSSGRQSGVFASVDCTFTGPAIQKRPNAFYRILREQDPVHFDKSLGMYLISRFDDLDAVFRHPVTFSQEKGYYSQMAHGYLEELKAMLERDGGGFFPDAVNVDPRAMSEFAGSLSRRSRRAR